MSKVSIIVPYLKGPAYLSECIESIEEENLEDFEVVLVDDKDGHDVPEDVMAKPFVKYVRLEDEVEELPPLPGYNFDETGAEDESGDEDDNPDDAAALHESKDGIDFSDDDPEHENSEEEIILRPFGVATARNIGIEKATGDYIYFMDGDDYLLTGALKQLVTLADEKKANLVTGSKASIWFRKISFDWEKANKESEIEGVHPLEGDILWERFKVNFSAQHLLLRRQFVLDNELSFDRRNTFYSDAPFVVGALAAAEGSAWIDGDSYYIWRHRNDPIHLPALCQKKRKRRGREFMESYEASLEKIKPGQTVLRNLIDYHLCGFAVKKYPERIKGEVAIKFTHYLKNLQDKSIKKMFSHTQKWILRFLTMGKYRLAKPYVKMTRAWHKKRGLFGKPIQYYRFFDKLIFRHMKLKENWVFIESFYGKYYNDSPKYLYEQLLRTYGNKYRYIWCLNKKSPMMKGKPTIVKRFSLRYVYYTTRCKYQIYNTRQPQWLKKREGQIFLDTWHGTPLKKLVFDLDDIHAASQNHKRMFYKQDRDWDYLISANRFSTDVFERAFDYPREQILEYGYPRNDILYAKNREEIAKEVKQELGIPEGKRVILYAPTWRDNQFYGKGQYKFSLAMDLERLRKEFGEDSVLLLRTHYYIADQLDLTGLTDFVYNGSKYEDVSRLYLISDICITDYSSVFFDYANLRRPILFFAYDYEDYKDEIRGLYISMEDDLPGPILQTNDELVEALHHMDEITEKYAKRYDEFYERFCSVDDGHASERTINKVFGEMTE